MKIPITCNNCGVLGHTSKKCNLPITSYGIVCYHVEDDNLRYMLIQRKDSLSYIEFIRGMYELGQREYIMKLFQNMTYDERHRIYDNTFEVLWNRLWFDTARKRFSHDFHFAKERFDRLKNGYKMRSADGSIMSMSLDYVREEIVDNGQYFETEWEFPKGRRQMNEQDIRCAMREFTEETGVDNRLLRLINCKPYEEIYIGTNKNRYRNIYFIAELSDQETIATLGKKVLNRVQMKEVSAVAWMSSEDVLENIRETYTERRELFARIHAYVSRSLSKNQKI